MAAWLGSHIVFPIRQVLPICCCAFFPTPAPTSLGIRGKIRRSEIALVFQTRSDDAFGR